MLKLLSEKRNQLSSVNQYLGYLSLVEQLGCSGSNLLLSLEEFELFLLPTLSSEEQQLLNVRTLIF